MNKIDVCDSEILIDYVLATSAARGLGLDSGYFKKDKESIHGDIVVAKQCGMLFVKLPEYVMKLLRDGYTGFKITCDEDIELSEHTFQLTSNTTIGFYL